MNKPYTKERLLRMMPDYIRQTSKHRTIKKNDYLYHKSEGVDYVYYVVRGGFRVVNEFESGKIYEPVVLPDQDFVGVVEAIHDYKEIISTIIAHEDSEVFQFKTELFLKWMKESHELTTWVLQTVSRNFIMNMEVSGENIILKSRYLLVNHILSNAMKANQVFILDEPRENTARRTGINIRTLYRHIKELKEEDLIQTKGRKIIFTKEQNDLLIKHLNDLRNR